jgi:hypothetical protein
MKGFIAAAACILAAGGASAQTACGPLRCEKPDLSIVSAAVGYELQAITGLDGGVEDRRGSAIYLYTDVKILSLALRRLPIRVHDALYLDLATGRMSSEPLTDVIGPEDTDIFSFDFGYHLMAGKQVGPVALMGGLGWQSASYTVGSTSLDGSARQFVVRAEYGPIVFTGFLPRGGHASSGARLDLPFFRRLKLTAMLWTHEGEIDSAFLTSGTASSTSLMVGVRTAEIR